MGENLVIGLFAALSLIFISVLFRFWRKHKRQKVVGDWRAVFFGNLLLFLTLVSMLLFGGECYYRFCYDKTDSLDYTKTSTRWFERYWHTNSTGCRDNVEYTLSIPRDKHRVTFLGDSFTAGQGIKNVDDRFVNRIRHAHPEWDVHMLAQLGFDTDNE